MMQWIKERIASPAALRQAGILSMNRRNLDFISRYNPRKLLPQVDDKLTTKRLAEKAGVDVPRLLAVLEYQHDISQLDAIAEQNEAFVIKPAQGSGGKGILVIIGRQKDRFVKASGDTLSYSDISRHVSNILGGLYSLGGKSDIAMIESLVVADPIFNEYSYEGVPDIRMIIFHGFPVMGMLRLATRASDGKANLHQGAVGVGLDIDSGASLRAIQYDQPIEHHPDTQKSFDKLSVPHWSRLLNLSSACFEMTGLGYLGVDIVLDKNQGPLILELNARPGLAIQIANGCGILPRLREIERMADKKLPTSEKVAYSRGRFAH